MCLKTHPKLLLLEPHAEDVISNEYFSRPSEAAAARPLPAFSLEEAPLATLSIQALDIWCLLHGKAPRGEMCLIEKG